MNGDGDKRSEEEAAWRDIVAHYGERAELGESELGSETVSPASGEESSAPAWRSFDPLEDEFDPFVPPDPPPLPRLPTERLVAWLCVLGAPIAAIVLVVLSMVTGWSTPHWVVAFLVVAFLGGFGFLVATMPKVRDDPWDDGARL